MKKIMTLLVMLLALLVTVNSCSNSREDVKALTDKNQNSSLLREVSSPENPENPFDECGKVHNLIMDKVGIYRYNFYNENGYMMDISSTIKYSGEVYLNDFSANYGYKDVYSVEDIENIIKDSENNYRNVVDKYSSTENTRLRNQELIDILVKASEEENITYDTLKERIIQFENNVTKDEKMSEEEKGDVLKASSIARYSAFYWNQELGSKSMETGRKWWKWLVVAISDVAGAVGGASVGGAIACAVEASSGAASLVDWISPENP